MQKQTQTLSIYERAEDINTIINGIITLADELEETIQQQTKNIDDLEFENIELKTEISNLNEENGGKDDEISRLNRIILELEERIEDLQ